KPAAEASAGTVGAEAGAAAAARGPHPDGGHPAHARRPRARAGAPPEHYVRCRVGATVDRLTLLDSHLVDGPLAAPSTLRGAGAYEVTAGDRLAHPGTVPDPGGGEGPRPTPRRPAAHRPQPRRTAGPAGPPPHPAQDVRVLGAHPGRGGHPRDHRGAAGAVAPP